MSMNPVSIDRRTLMLCLAGAGLPIATPSLGTAAAFPSRRPPPAARRFASAAVDRTIARVSARIADAEIAWMFGNCYPNTLDTAIETGIVDGAPDTFVITGDIPCMWLRDSAAQLFAYLPLAKRDERLRALFRGAIARHARSILIDPYANAFLRDPAASTTLSWAKGDLTAMRPGVAERKWELDGPCHVIRLAHGYWTATRDPAPFGALWEASALAIVRTFREQQRKDGPGPYRFQRVSENPADTQLLDGYGAPSRRVGLIHSIFRPSDDASTLPFVVPSNLFAVTALRQLATIAAEARGNMTLAQDARALATEVQDALARHAVIGVAGATHWAYEIDGFGNALFLDDANIPSLSSLAYLGCAARDDPLFRRTEALCWSDANPYFFRGPAGEGIGGVHVGLGHIWPMSIIVRALSSDDPATIRACLRALKASHAGTGFIHESFDAADARTFTRPWFAWANGLFGELILSLASRRPDILAEPL